MPQVNKPLRKKYESQSTITRLMNANEGTDKYVNVDWKSYAKDLEKYVEHLEGMFTLACNELGWMAKRDDGKGRYIQLIGHEEQFLDWRAKNPHASTDDLSTWEDRIQMRRIMLE